MKLKHLARALLLALPLSSFAALPSGIVLENFDPKVRIQDDLFLAINGGWINKTEIPGDLSTWGAFHELRDLSESRVRSIIETANANPTDANAKQIAALYQSFMNEAQAEKLGVSPLQPLLAQVQGIKNQAELFKQMGTLQQAGLGMPLHMVIGADEKDSGHYLVNLYQSGLGLPDRDYFLKDEPRFAAARSAYETYLNTLFKLAGYAETDALAKARNVIALEAKLALVQWSKVDNRDPHKTYNKLSLKQLQKKVPGFNWQGFLKAAGVASEKAVNLNQPSYALGLAKLVKSEPLSVWQDYLSARALHAYAPYLSKAFVDAHFAFTGQALTGAKEQKPRWKRGVALVEGAVGESLGQLYVAKHFSPSAKQKMEVLVGNLMKAYEQSIDKLTWMSPATRKAAHAKLATYQVKIGYPNKWRDYSALELKADDLIGNIQRSNRFDYAHELARLGKPVDRSEWGMTPQTVNAYYNPSNNEIVFPAAILQPPFFNAEADDAVNYGGIGAVIGHEISHGFDDQGAQFDGQGNLNNWWKAEDKKAFDGLTARLVAQYEQYEPIAGKKVNGKLTLGENIADLSGMQIAHKAYQLSLGNQPGEVIDGFTSDQRFFIGFAQVWRSKMREAYSLQLLTSDPHSPSRFRPIGAAVNSDAFMNAFGVKQGDGMYKPEAERIRIW